MFQWLAAQLAIKCLINISSDDLLSEVGITIICIICKQPSSFVLGSF